MMVVPYISPTQPWMPMESLDGDVLFLGGSGSRSFAASEFGGDHADCIYFTNDKYHLWEWQESSMHLWDVHFLLNGEGAKKPCRDIGKFCMRSQSVTFSKIGPGTSPARGRHGFTSRTRGAR